MAHVFRRLHATLDRIDATIDRNSDAFERNSEAFDRYVRAFEDLQAVIRESRVREERALQAFEQRLDANATLLARQMEANTRRTEAMTEALWRMLDRWGEGPTPAS